MADTHTTTAYDTEIEALEKRRPELEAERKQLEDGQLTVQGLDGQMVKVDLSKFVADLDINNSNQVNTKLQQLLAESPVYQDLVNGYRTKDEVKEAMIVAGVLPSKATALKAKSKLLLANHQINKKTSKLGAVAKFLNSPWLMLAIAIFALLIWGGSSLLYWASGGNIGGVSDAPAQVKATPTEKSNAVHTLKPVNFFATPTPKPEKKSGLGQNAFEADYIPAETNGSQDDYTEPATTQITESTVTPTPDSANYVGGLPTSLDGLNGPHGAFLAPSRMVVTALNIDVPIEKAIVQEQVITALTTPTTTVSSDQSQATPAAPAVGVSIVWPRPGEVLQYGAFPGEVGNCLIFGTQENLADLRHIQQNDLIKLYDRDNNLYLYRVVAFSPTGQPERVINPATDSWVFAPSEDEATLTIIVSMPQPLPPVNPNQSSNQAGNQNQPVAQDDFISGKKLAYRAVLVSYSPNSKATPVGTPVEVDNSVWQTEPASTQPPAAVVSTTTPAPTTPTATATPTPTPQYPNLPDTGFGGQARTKGGVTEILTKAQSQSLNY